jgi:tetratricopeptide (TPR) repeat protein
MLALLTAVGAAKAQSNADAYRQAVLSIQQRIEGGDFDGARSMIADAEKKYPANGGLENLLGVIEIQQGHTEQAREDFSAAMRHDPKLASACLNLSRIDMQTAAEDGTARTEAVRLSERVLQLEPGNDEAHYQLGTIFAWNKNYQGSLDQLAKLSVQAREEIGAEALRCSDEAALGHRDETTRAADALAANPELTEQDADTCLPQLRGARRADLIEEIFAAAAKRQPLSAAGLRILGLAQEAEGKLKEARATLESAYGADATSAVVLVDLARVAEAAEDHEGALGYLAHARDMQPADASLPYEFGVICLKLNLFGEAQRALQQALKLDPENPDYNYELGVVDSLSNDPVGALPYLNKFHSLKPQDAGGDLALGATYFRAMRYDIATNWLKQAAADARYASLAQYYLGRIARQQGHFDEAIVELKQYLAQHPDQADVLAEIGLAYLGKDDFALAGPALERAVQLDPDNYMANFGLLQLYARTSDARRKQQAKRFEEIRNKRDEREDQVMRQIEFRRDGASP